VAEDLAAGVFDGGTFPVQGWWIVRLEQKGMLATFRMRQADGSFQNVYRAWHTRKAGWKAEVIHN
jgi:hypothetical protein